MRFVFALAAGVGAALWVLSQKAAEERASADSDGAEPADGSTDASGDGAKAAPAKSAPAKPTKSSKPAKPAPAPTGANGAAPASKPNIAAAVGEPDDLTRIKGIGSKLSEMCQSLGVKRFDQIAAWSEADIAEVDKHLKIKGRITRDQWVEQAKALAAGEASD